MTPNACLRCGAGPLRPRARSDLAGVPHAGRGLCRPCHRAHGSEYAPLGRGGYRTGRPALHVAEDVADLGAKSTATRIGFDVGSRRSVALRLGVTLSTLDRALYRARNQRDAA